MVNMITTEEEQTTDLFFLRTDEFFLYTMYGYASTVVAYYVALSME